VSWDDRAQAYRESETHRAGEDLDALVAWCDPAPGVEALDVATGGGHVANRLRALGCTVTTCDAAAGMEPDVVCAAEALPAGSTWSRAGSPPTTSPIPAGRWPRWPASAGGWW
jgi:hypothetical protein